MRFIGEFGFFLHPALADRAALADLVWLQSGQESGFSSDREENENKLNN